MGELHQIQVGNERRILVPIPKAPGFHVHCHASIVVECKTCGARPNEPCTTDRGSMAFSRGLVHVIRKLAHGVTPDKRDLEKLREYLDLTKQFRQDTHEARKLRWRSMGLHNPRGPRDNPPPKLTSGQVSGLASIVRWYQRNR